MCSRASDSSSVRCAPADLQTTSSIVAESGTYPSLRGADPPPSDMFLPRPQYRPKCLLQVNASRGDRSGKERLPKFCPTTARERIARGRAKQGRFGSNVAVGCAREKCSASGRGPDAKTAFVAASGFR